ncbi:LuxR C-terminal-related transcriptional regulator [Streptomyces sp. NPDC048172]|uniref:LuxR C-terminal-related transcriptional regulator n=1 Tax=Streptomyces sp. NPDC048172 TaxID=3365505 RepID=UPI003710DD1B
MPRADVLEGRLRELGQDAPGADAAVAACLEWVAGTLVDLAASLDDARAAEVLVEGASEILAQVVGDRAGDAAGAARADVHGTLTEREHEVLVALQQDDPLRQIAASLFISRNTVKSHTRALYRKLGASTRTEALARARELSLLPDGAQGGVQHGVHSSSSSRARRTAAERRLTCSLR